VATAAGQLGSNRIKGWSKAKRKSSLHSSTNCIWPKCKCKSFGK